jgi:superfamily II DNA/RNA helicase
MLRRTKDEVLDLPPKLRRWVPVSVPDGTAEKETRRLLETLIASALGRARGRTEGDRPRTARSLGQDRTRLLADLTKLRVQIAKAKVPTTIEFVDGVVAQGQKVIVFSAFDEPVKRIAEHLGTSAVVITGKTPTAKRQALVDRFQRDDDVRVLVANIVAGGVGLNLTAARQVVFNDLDWVPANHWQAEDRAYRIGQRGSVNVTYFAASGTIDEFVSHVLRVKGALIEAVIEGRGPVPESGDLLADLESLVLALSPNIATLDDAESGEHPVDRLLREVTRAVAEADEPELSRVRRDALRQLPAEALRALARVLAGPTTQRYRVASSSRPGAHYALDVDGGDVTCDCPGFSYRGACSHARSLKRSLALGGALPDGFAFENGN